MTPHQVAVFMEEHRLDYFFFGFTSALLESIPLIGIGFSISNRIGAAMWAFGTSSLICLNFRVCHGY